MPDTDTPDAPETAPKYIIEGLGKQSPETLEAIAEYAERLAAEKRVAVRDELQSEEAVSDEPPEEWDAGEWEAATSDADAPAKATVTVKEIDGREYYYYQWRDGSKIKSEYIAPVNPS